MDIMARPSNNLLGGYLCAGQYSRPSSGHGEKGGGAISRHHQIVTPPPIIRSRLVCAKVRLTTVVHRWAEFPSRYPGKGLGTRTNGLPLLYMDPCRIYLTFGNMSTASKSQPRTRGGKTGRDCGLLTSTRPAPSTLLCLSRRSWSQQAALPGERAKV